jgi:hypothetical protein
MRWIVIAIIVFICAFLLIMPMYIKKGKKSKGPLPESEQDDGSGSEAVPDQ